MGGRLRGTWMCRSCKRFNRPGTTGCRDCGSPKPRSKPKPKQTRRSPAAKKPERESEVRPSDAGGKKRRGPSLSNTPLALSIEESVRKRLAEQEMAEADA